MSQPIGASDYYDTLPSGAHQPGDIWTALPTHGILVQALTPALIITPSCDLANRKTETLTYLPILALREYLSSRAFLPELLRECDERSKTSGHALGLREGRLPSAADLGAALALVEKALVGTLNSATRGLLERTRAGVLASQTALHGEHRSGQENRIKELYGAKPFSALIERLVTNGNRADTHFLPADDQPRDWSAIPEPSLVMFRYPMTVPIEVLEAAQSESPMSWGAARASLATSYSCACRFGDALPLKSLRIRPRFLSDLLTRFTSLYGRIGSPDLPSPTVQRIVSQVVGGT